MKLLKDYCFLETNQNTLESLERELRKEFSITIIMGTGLDMRRNPRGSH